MSSHLVSHHPQEVLLAQFSLYVHKSGLKPDLFHFNCLGHHFGVSIFTRGCARRAVPDEALGCSSARMEDLERAIGGLKGVMGEEVLNLRPHSCMCRDFDGCNNDTMSKRKSLQLKYLTDLTPRALTCLILSQLKLCLAATTHNFKLLKMYAICEI